LKNVFFLVFFVKYNVSGAFVHEFCRLEFGLKLEVDTRQQLIMV